MNLFVNAPNNVLMSAEAIGMILVRTGPVPIVLISAAFVEVIFVNNK
jgi:hypothetical protein